MSARSSRVLGSNPYVVGPPVYGEGPFFGRKEEIERITSAARKGGGLLVVGGGRRIGKSSLLRHISVAKLSGLLPVYLDTALGPDSTSSAALTAFSHDLARGLEIDAAPLLEVVAEPSAWAKAAYRAAQPKIAKRRLLLLVDVERAGPAPEVLSALVELATAGARVFGAFASSPAVLQAMAGQEVLRVDLPVLSPTEGRQLIGEPVGESLVFEEDAILHLFDLSGRNPALLQALCYETFEIVRVRPVEEVGMMEVVAASKRIETVPTSLDWVWDGLPAEERVLLAAMAEAAPIDRPVFLNELRDVLASFNVDPGDAAFGERLKSLVESGFLRRDGSSRVAFALEILRRWINLHHPLESMKQARMEGQTARAVAHRHLALARDAHLLGRINTAVEEYRRALESDPTYTETTLGLGRVLSESGRHREAVDVLKTALPAEPEAAREELADAFLRWVTELKSGGRSTEAVLAEGLELVPDDEQLRRLQEQLHLEDVRARLASPRTRDALQGMEMLLASSNAAGLAVLRRLAVDHLERALAAGAGRRGRLVADYVACLRRCYPDDGRPALLFAEFLVSEAEKLEVSSPPAAQSHYRRAEEALAGLPAGEDVPEALSRRLEMGRNRIAALFLHEQETSLSQLLAEGQYQAAESLARELVTEHNSSAARRALETLEARRAHEVAFGRILDALARGARDEAIRLATELHRRAPDYAGPDGRSAAEILTGLGAAIEAPAPPPPPPAAPVPGPRPITVPAAMSAAPAKVVPATPPAPVAPPPLPSSSQLPIPPPPRPRSNTALWMAFVGLAAVVVAREVWFWQKDRPDEVAPPVADPAPFQASSTSLDLRPAAPATPAQVEALPPAAAPVELTEEQRRQVNELVLRGRKEVNLGAYLMAEESYRAALALNPQDPAILHHLGLVYYFLKQYNNAETQLKQSLALRDAGQVRFDLGKVYWTQARHPEASTELRLALQDPDLSPSLVLEAEKYLQEMAAADARGDAPVDAAAPSEAVPPPVAPAPVAPKAAATATPKPAPVPVAAPKPAPPTGGSAASKASPPPTTQAQPAASAPAKPTPTPKPKAEAGKPPAKPAPGPRLIGASVWGDQTTEVQLGGDEGKKGK